MRYAIIVTLMVLALVSFSCMEESGNEPLTQSSVTRHIEK